MIFMIKAHVRHWFGVHTWVYEFRKPGIWCYICGQRLLHK